MTRSLLAKLDAAQDAVDRGQPRVARLILVAFVAQTWAQRGKGISPEAADALIADAIAIIRQAC